MTRVPFLPLIAALAVFFAVLAAVDTAAAQTPSGEAVYKTQCASCHDSTSPRVPPRDALRKMPAARN